MIICGTGHRPNKLGGYSTDAERQLWQFAKTQLMRLRPKLVISGGALGWDTALARAAFVLKIPYDLYVPFRGQELAWPPASRESYHKMVNYANSVVICSDGGYAAWKMQERNKRMVCASTKVLALWDGSSGGTANCVAFATQIGKPVDNCWKEWNENRSRTLL